MPSIKGGAAIPVKQMTSGPVKAGPAIPVYGYAGTPADRPASSGPARPVKVLTDADLRQNGGAYVVAGEAQAMPVYDAPAGMAVAGEAAIPVYPVNAVNWLLGAATSVLADRLSSNATPVYNNPDPNAYCTLQAGHTWSQSNNAGSMNYTTDKYQGSQCLQITTLGNGTAAYVTSPRMTAVNLTAKSVRFWFKIDPASESQLLRIVFYLGGGASALTWFSTQYIIVPADNNITLMRAADGWYGLTFNPAFFLSITNTPDWTQVRDFRFRVEDKSAGAVTVLLGGMEFIPTHASYPHGVVSINFDDGYAATDTIAKPKLDAYGFRATAYIIRDLLGTGSYLSQAQLQDLIAGGWEIEAHANTWVDHNTGFDALDTATASADLQAELAWLKTLRSGRPSVWAYPGGLFTPAMISAVARPLFSAGRTIVQRTLETMPLGDPYRLRTFVVANTTAVTPNTAVGSLEWLVDQAYATGGWLIPTFHNIVTSPTIATEYATASFNTFVDYCNTKGIPVQTMSKVLYGS